MTPAPAKVAEDKGARAHRIARYLLIGVVVLAPLPFGSVDPMWVGLWSMVLAVAMPLFDLREMSRAQIAALAVVLAGFLLVLLTVLLQMWPDPPLLPVHRLWAQTEALLGTTLRKTVSVDPHGSWVALSRPLLLALTLACAILSSHRRSEALTLMNAVGLSGAAYAFYGIAAFLIDPNEILGLEKTAYEQDLTSTFVNRNTAATYFGMILILWAVRLLTELNERLPKTISRLGDVGAAILNSPSREMVVAAASSAVLLAALLMTRSRAGIVLSLGALAVAVVLRLWPRLQTRAGLLFAAAVAVLVIGPLVELLGGAVALRIGDQGLVDQGRIAAYLASVEIVRQYPLLGTGLGSFVDVFPAYRDAAIGTVGIWDRAHSTPLEIAVELGLPFTVLLAAFWLLGMGQLLRASFQSRRGLRVVIVAFAAALLGTLHSLVDFSPQVPGFAIVWFAVIGCGLSQSLARQKGGRTVRVAPASDLGDAVAAGGAAR